MAGKIRRRVLSDPVIPTVADANELIDTLNEIHAMLTILVGSITELRPVKCEDCGITFSSHPDFLNHLTAIERHADLK